MSGMTKEGTYLNEKGELMELYTKREKGKEIFLLKAEQFNEPRAVMWTERLWEKALVKETKTDIAVHIVAKESSEELLVFLMNRLKAQGVQEAGIKDAKFLKAAALEAGFKQKGREMWIDCLQKRAFRVKRDNERTIARYCLNGKEYVLKRCDRQSKYMITKKAWNTALIEEKDTGLAVAATRWDENRHTGSIAMVKTSMESARMAKTTMIYALWEMKKQGIGRVTLTFHPEMGCREKAEGLYRSVGFERMGQTPTWQMDLSRTELQKMHLK